MSWLRSPAANCSGKPQTEVHKYIQLFVFQPDVDTKPQAGRNWIYRYGSPEKLQRFGEIKTLPSVATESMK